MNKKFYWFLAAQSLSESGTSLASGGLAYLLYLKTGGVGQLGLILASPVLPLLIGGMFIGTIADRREARRMMLITNIILAVIISLTPGAILLPTPTWLLGLIALQIGKDLVNQGYIAAYKRSFRALISDEEMSRAASVESAISRLAVTVGLALGPWVAANYGIAVFFLDAITNLIACAIVLKLRFRAPGIPASNEVTVRGRFMSLLRDTGAGLTYAGRNPRYLSVLIAYCTGFIIWATLEVSGIALMSWVGINEKAYGAFNAVASISEFCTAAYLLTSGLEFTPAIVFTASAVLSGSVFALGVLAYLHVALPVAAVTALAYGLRALTGVASNLLGVMAANLLMVRVPKDIQGRLGGMVDVVSMSIFAGWKLAAGLITDSASAPAAFATTGAFALAATVWAWRMNRISAVKERLAAAAKNKH